jgi:hypothetical protein
MELHDFDPLRLVKNPILERSQINAQVLFQLARLTAANRSSDDRGVTKGPGMKETDHGDLFLSSSSAADSRDRR